MAENMRDILNPGLKVNKSADFPYAPEDWSKSAAETIASKEGIQLRDDHWKMVSALQEYFSKHDESELNMRELRDALDEKFHSKGGIKYLYGLFPSGPVAQGCRLAGLPVPPGAQNNSFGSVQ